MRKEIDSMGYVLLHAGQPAAKLLLNRVANLTGAVRLDTVTSSDVTIRWGNERVPDPDGWVLNPLRAVENAAQRNMLLRMLRQAGIRCPGSRGTTDEKGRLTMIRHYRVPVFDSKPIGCFRSDGRAVWLNQRVTQIQDRFREVKMDEDRYTARAVDWSVKATRALGLDVGLVSLGLTPRNLMTVLDVTAAPVLKGRLLELYSEALTGFIQENESADEVNTNVQLGTDLEFMLRNQQGKMVLASKYFTRKGSVGCDDRSIQGDGHRLPLAELRPDPDSSPIRLVENIRRTMLYGYSLAKAQNISWVAGSMPFPGFWIGGHIHFSQIGFNSRLAKALDAYVGLPVMMIENALTARKRRPRYGFLGDIRHKDHGGFEYRTPGSFVVSPEITTAVLCLAHVVAAHYRQLPYLSPFADAALQQAFYTSNKDRLIGLFHTIWDYLSRQPLYDRYRAHLDVISNMVSNGISWNEDVDIRKSWGLSVPVVTGSRVGNRPLIARQARLG